MDIIAGGNSKNSHVFFCLAILYFAKWYDSKSRIGTFIKISSTGRLYMIRECRPAVVHVRHSRLWVGVEIAGTYQSNLKYILVKTYNYDVAFYVRTYFLMF